MKIRFRFLLYTVMVVIINGFPINKSFTIRRIRLNYFIVKKNVRITLVNRMRIVSRNQNEIVDKSVSIFYDNMLSDMLGFAKIYNLVNDETKTYLYIVAYEFAWFAFKVLQKNVSEKSFEINDDESQILFEQLILNVLLYVTIKNIIFKNILHIISQ